MGVLLFIWAQQLFTLGIFGAVAIFQNANAPVDTEAISSYGLIFTALAVVFMLGGLAVRSLKGGTHALPLLFSRSDTVWGQGLSAEEKAAVNEEAMHLYKTATIIGTAGAEAAAVCGLVLALMTKMTMLYVPFAGAAGAMLLWQIPNQASLNAVCAALEKKRHSAA